MNQAVPINKVAIFRAGDYGDKGVYTSEDIARLARNYDPKNGHEAGVTIDHKNEGPRFGRIVAAYADGALLYADLEVIPSFADTVRQGLYDKRSIEIYRDENGTPSAIRNVTFLGAQPPEVKGLPPLPKFSEAGKSEIINFMESKKMDETQLKELAAVIGATIAEAIKPLSDQIAALKEVEMAEGEKSAADILAEEEKAKAEKEKSAVAMSEGKGADRFAAIEAAIKDTIEENKALRAKLHQAEAASRTAAFVAKFSDRLTPAQKPLFEKLHATLSNVAYFSDGKNNPGLEAVEAFAETLPKHNLAAKTSKAPDTFGDSNANLEAMFSEAQKLVKDGQFPTTVDAITYLQTKG